MSAGGRDRAGAEDTTAEEAARKLGSDPEVGLTTHEADARLREHGHNEVPEKRRNRLIGLVSKFWGPGAWMLELIIVLSWVLHRDADLWVVSALLVVNAILSFAQEQRAADVVETLRERLQVSARVLRDGVWRVIPARELVPGDVVRVRSGDLAPADVKVAHGTLSVDQSALTGESTEAQKLPGATLYSGTTVRRGEADGVVVATGVGTYFGRTVQLVQLARPKLHIEEVVAGVVKWLLLIVVALLAVAVVVAVLRGIPLIEMLPLMLVLLLGAVPVALPVMFTVSMAVGSMELARRNVLVTRLSASEEAATMDVLCVDKTGTITENKLSVAEVVPLGEANEADAILYGALASEEANQDPIDLAFIRAARQRRLDGGPFVRQSFTPFDPQTRRTEALVQAPGRVLRVMKGAVSAVAQACGPGAHEVEEVEARTSQYAERGYRVLAVAAGEANEQPVLVGLVMLSDPPRADSKTLINELRNLGVSVKMLTGDALPIARETARLVGLGTNMARLPDLEEERGAGEAAKRAEASDGFAEVYPEGKYTVVKSLQAKGHVVGMTGDGVNDAPALRQAEVGIAVSGATDVAKGAAIVVLTAGGLASIVDLVKNGRRIHKRIVTWIINKISRTVLKCAFVVFAFLFTGKFVVSASAMIVMIFMTDFVKIALATDNVRWSKTPETWSIASQVKLAVVLGVIMVIEASVLLFVGLRFFGLLGNDQALYAFSFEVLLYFAIFSIVCIRERRHFWESMPSPTLLAALALDAIVGAVIATVGLPGLGPLPLQQTAFVFLSAFLFSLLVNDQIKFLILRGD
jgi:plasma-membrane proton-efflux P-type ATPase